MIKYVMKVRWWIVLSVILFYSPVVHATTRSPDVRSLVQEWVAANNSHDIESFKKLIHPECLKKMTAQNKDYYDDVIARTLKYQIPENYTFYVLPIPNQEQGQGMDGLSNYPVNPMYRIQIDFDRKKYNGVTLMREIAIEGHRWFFVFADPTEQALVKFREKKALEQKDLLEAKQIAKDLDPLLIKELEDLIAQKGKVSAFKKLSEAKSISLDLAMKVLKELGLDE